MAPKHAPEHARPADRPAKRDQRSVRDDRGQNRCVRLLQLNVCLLPIVHTTENDKKRERFNELLQRVDEFDVLTLQEVWTLPWTSQTRRCAEQLAERGFFVVYTEPPAWSPLGLNCGNLIASRFPVGLASSYVYSSSDGWQRIVPNAALLAALHVPGAQPLAVVSTHLHTDNSYTPAGIQFAPVRAAQVRELAGWLDEALDKERHHVVVAGDMNIRAPSAEYEETVRVLGAHACAMHKAGFPSTLDPSCFLSTGSWSSPGALGCVDHVLAASPRPEAGLRIEEASAVQTTPPMSDHLPIAVRIKLPEA